MSNNFVYHPADKYILIYCNATSLTLSVHPSARSWRFGWQLFKRGRGGSSDVIGSGARWKVKCLLLCAPYSPFFSFSASCQPRRERRLGVYCPSTDIVYGPLRAARGTDGELQRARLGRRMECRSESSAMEMGEIVFPFVPSSPEQ